MSDTSFADTDVPLAKMSLGQIAAQLPGATVIFRKAGLDFCCGGNVALDEAAARKGLALGDLVARLSALAPGEAETAPSEPAALIPHILAHYHEVHRREFPELIRLAKRVEAVHRAHASVPEGLAFALEDMSAELETHMQKEEVILFPMMLSGGNPMIVHPIAIMRGEHDEHGERLRRIEALTHGFQPPVDACSTWRALYSGLRKLTDDLMEHIHLENNMLFPRFTAGS